MGDRNADKRVSLSNTIDEVFFPQFHFHAYLFFSNFAKQTTRLPFTLNDDMPDVISYCHAATGPLLKSVYVGIECCDLSKCS